MKVIEVIEVVGDMLRFKHDAPGQLPCCFLLWVCLIGVIVNIWGLFV